MCACVVCVPEDEGKEEDRSGEVGASAIEVLMAGGMLWVCKEGSGCGVAQALQGPWCDNKMRESRDELNQR